MPFSALPTDYTDKVSNSAIPPTAKELITAGIVNAVNAAANDLQTRAAAVEASGGPAKLGLANTYAVAQKTQVASALKWEGWDATQQVAAIRADNPSNVGVGKDALLSNTVTGVGSEGLYNTAIGASALYSNTTGSYNTVIGTSCLYSNTTGSYNTAIGTSCLYSNTTGSYNTAIGANALVFNTTGSQNTAVGASALYSNTTGSQNIAIGTSALVFNTTGSQNIAIGVDALYSPGGVPANATTIGLRQTAVGVGTGQASATQRNDIVAVGYRALVGGDNTVAVGSGAQALHTGAVALGKDTVSTAIDQVMIGPRHVAMAEQTNPGAAGADGARLYARDNGAGKTQLCVVFNTGAVQIIASQP